MEKNKGNRINTFPKKGQRQGKSKAELLKTGYELGLQIVDRLADHGCTKDGLIIETFALAMAWASLQKIANLYGYDATAAFEHDTQLMKEYIEEDGIIDMINDEYGKEDK